MWRDRGAKLSGRVLSLDASPLPRHLAVQTRITVQPDQTHAVVEDLVIAAVR